MKKLSLLFLTVMLGMGVFAQTTYFWREEAGNGNWNDANNWWTNTTALPTGGEILSFGNNNQTTMTNDLSATNRHQIIFTSSANQSRTISGTTENTFNKVGSNKPKIENNSSANHTIDFPLKWEYIANSAMELKPVSGDLTITKAINNNGLWTDVLGGNGKTLSIASMSGAGGLTIKNNNNNKTTVKITGTSTYTGNTNVDYGTLELQADLSSAEIIVKSGAKLIINGTDVDVQILTIKSGGTVEVLPGKSLTVNGVLTNGGILTLKSDANGTATIKTLGTVTTGATNYKVEQYLASQRNWYMSSPVSSASVTLDGSATATYYTHSESTATTETDGWSSALTSFPTVDAAQGFIVKPSVAANITFAGTLNNADVEIALTNTSNTPKPGYNLVGNPYPSYLSWKDIYTISGNSTALSEGTMWYRTVVNNYYKFVTVNGQGVASSSNVTDDIPPMQAFWVNAATAGGTLTINNSLRKHNTSGTANLLKAPAASEYPMLRLVVSNGTLSDEAVVYISSQSSDSKDAYDAQKMFNGNAVPEIYTLLNGTAIAINSMNTIPYDTEMALGFRTQQGGSFSISAGEFSSFASGDKVVLKDKQTGTETDLSLGAYSFTADAGINDTRFAILFPKSGVPTSVEGTSGSSLSVYSHNGNIQLSGVAAGANAAIYNSLGQRIATKVTESGLTRFEQYFRPGVYIVKVQSEGNELSGKVIVK